MPRIGKSTLHLIRRQFAIVNKLFSNGKKDNERKIREILEGKIMPEIALIDRSLIRKVTLNHNLICKCLKDAGPFEFNPPMIAVPHNNIEIMQGEVNVGQVRLFAADGNLIFEGDNAERLGRHILENPKIKNSDFLTILSLDDGRVFIKWYNQKTGEEYRIPYKHEWLAATSLIDDMIKHELRKTISLEEAIANGKRYRMPETPILSAPKLEGDHFEWTETEHTYYRKSTDRFYLCTRQSLKEIHEHRGARQLDYALRLVKKKIQHIV